MSSFFANSDLIDHEVLRPLSHIHGNWELSWDTRHQQYREEDNSYARLLNTLIKELDNTVPPSRYHDNEDRLAEYVRDRLKWPIRKQGQRWVGADYDWLIEQGGFDDLDEKDLILAAAGRIHAAQAHGQKHYDDIEESHRRMLAAVLSVILYHRTESER